MIAGRAHNRATSRWEALEAEDSSGSESDPEEELEQLRQQVRARVKASAWAGRDGSGPPSGIGVAELERRLRGAL